MHWSSVDIDGGKHMTLLTRVRALFEDGPIYECRRCGTTLDSEFDECPACGIRDVARYDIR